MNTVPLPNLFLADMPPDLQLTPAMVRDACFALRRNREKWLALRRTRELIEMIAYTAEQWLQPDYGFRNLALELGPDDTGFRPATLAARGLDHFFRSLTVENLEGLVSQDLGDPRRLDDFTASVAEMRGGRTAIASGPELLVHIAAGNLPSPIMLGLVLGLLVKSAQFIKCSRGGSLLPRLFAHSLAQTEPKLGASLELAIWPGGALVLEEALFQEAGCVTATGTDETISDIRGRVPIGTRFVGYGHRVSFGFVGRETLTVYSARRVVRDAATDIVAWNQLGCLSPHVFYVQEDGVTSPEGFAEMLAQELARREGEEPRGELSVDEAGLIANRRAVYELRLSQRANPPERRRQESIFVDDAQQLRLWQSEGSTAWTVVFENDPRFQISCLNRFIYIKPVKNLGEALRHADPIRPRVSTVGLAALDDRAVEYARELAKWGVPRICPLGQMQQPPLGWRHDGRPALGDLVTWTDFES